MRSVYSVFRCWLLLTRPCFHSSPSSSLWLRFFRLLSLSDVRICNMYLYLYLRLDTSLTLQPTQRQWCIYTVQFYIRTLCTWKWLENDNLFYRGRLETSKMWILIKLEVFSTPFCAPSLFNYLRFSCNQVVSFGKGIFFVRVVRRSFSVWCLRVIVCFVFLEHLFFKKRRDLLLSTLVVEIRRSITRWVISSVCFRGANFYITMNKITSGKRFLGYLSVKGRTIDEKAIQSERKSEGESRLNYILNSKIQSVSYSWGILQIGNILKTILKLYLFFWLMIL